MIGDWGEVVTRYPYRKVRMDHLLSKEKIMMVVCKSSSFILIVPLLGMIDCKVRTMRNE